MCNTFVLDTSGVISIQTLILQTVEPGVVDVKK